MSIVCNSICRDKKEIEIAVARTLFEVKAVKINVAEPFTFASGIRSPIYCDNRSLLGWPQQRTLITEAFTQLIPADTDVIAGVATAGVPWAAFIANALNKPLAYVRSAPKDHGTGSTIEGAAVAGKKIALIEDLISTGKSSIGAVKSLRAAGAAEVSLKAIFSYQFAQADTNFKNEGCPFESLSRFSVLIELLQKEKYLSPEEAAIALEWNKEPETWFDRVRRG